MGEGRLTDPTFAGDDDFEHVGGAAEMMSEIQL
jgi:hypothetical protein